MKKILLFFIFCICTINLLNIEYVYSASRPGSKKGIYFAQGRAGGASGDLDALDITGVGSPNAYDLIDGDTAIVGEITGSATDFYIYVFDVNGTDAEDDPFVIRPDDYSSGGVWILAEFHANGFNSPKASGVAGFVSLYEANSTDTDYVAWMGPASIAESFSHQFSNTQPAGSFYLWGTPAGSGDPNGNKISVCTLVTPGTGVVTALAINVGSAGAFITYNGNAGTPSAINLTNGTNLPSSGITTIVDSVAWDAGGMTPDGTQCADAAKVTINSGPVQYTIICADNDASTMYGHIVMPDSWDGGTVTFEGEYLQTAADTSALNSDVTMMCRGAGETVNSTWGTEVALDDAAVTGSNGVDHTTTTAITPNGTCAGGDTLYWRWQLDATGTTTAVATLHFLGAKIEYTSNVGD